MKLISIVTPCYNEEGNIKEVYEQVKSVFVTMPQYQYEHLFIDNASTDQTLPILKSLASLDHHIKIIANTRNFGHIRSPFHALMQIRGEAAIMLSADLQDPPALIPEFIERWESGFKIVVGVKPSTEEAFPLSSQRRTYYNLITKIAEVKLIKNFTGFGLYDREVIEIIRTIDDGYPYFRGLISEIGFPIAEVPFHQAVRQRGISKNNLYTLYDMAVLGITAHSKFPIRLATIIGFILSMISLLTAFVFLFLKLFFWYKYPVGIAPILIGMFFFASMQLFFTGILGEYVLSIHRQIFKRPLVIEKERINFSIAKETE